VTFLSDGTNLGPGFTDTNGAFDIFVFERATGSISLASHTSSPTTAGNGNSNAEAVSRDGSWIAFVSASSNLGSGISDSNGFNDVFLYQRGTGILTLVSHASTPTVTANRASANPRLSQDGSWVAFSSNATDIGVGLTDTNGAQSDVFLFQRATAAISLVSHAASTSTTGNVGSDSLALSAGGGFVAFRSSASDLGPGFVEHAGTDAYLYERATAGIVAASRADGPGSATGGGVSYTTGGTRYSVSDDGRYVVFSSEARWTGTAARTSSSTTG
jgi:Tol biopolymer transport system component